ncbi:MAG: transglycosylase domain-containing protein [Actinomycetota bacterium]
MTLQQVFDPLGGPIPARNRRRNPLWRLRRVFFVMLLFGLVGAGTVLYAFSQTDLPEDRVEELLQTSFICTAEIQTGCGPDNAAALLASPAEDREFVEFEELPENLVQAVVATEDQDFFEHQGVDPRGIARAGYQYFLGSGVVQGGSTITQQYVKLAFNDQERNLSRKAREAIRAVKLEQELTRECASQPDIADDAAARQCAKEEILTRYLNRAYFGRGASGVKAAARIYFDKDVSELEVHESAFLAGLLRNPVGADPQDDLDEANRRRTVSLELMLQAGFLTVDEAQAANQAEWRVAERQSREGLGEVAGAAWGSEYFIEEVRQQLFELYPNGEIYTDGLRVYTTLHQNLQRAAYETAHAPKPGEDLETRDLPELGPLYLDPNNSDDPAASIVSVDAEGRVVAMLGGTNFEESEFNLATSSGLDGRQPGSTFKTFGLALAIEQGISARSFYSAWPPRMEFDGRCKSNDGPWRVSGGSSARYRYRDLVDGLRWSSNLVYAQLGIEVGPDLLKNQARDLGINSSLGPEGQLAPCSLILGSAGVPVVEMAGAYSVFERDGVQLDPVLIERIEDVDGNVICWYPVGTECGSGPTRQGEQVLQVETVHQVNYALGEVVRGGTGKRAQFSEEVAVVGKTGTSQLSKDGWFAGFTCDLTTVVWIGYPEAETSMYDFRKPLEEGQTEKPVDEDGNLIDDRNWPNIEGGNFPTMLWADYMAKATAGRAPCTEIPMSEDFAGTRLNQDLSTTTLPPCGVELDEFGFPYGDGPESFRYITTTTAPPNTQPPNGQPDPDDPQGLTQQNNGNGNGNGQQPSPPPTDPCIAVEFWARQADPNAPIPTNLPGQPSTQDPNQTTDPNDPNDTTTTVDPGQSTTVTDPNQSTTTEDTQPPTTPPSTVDTQPTSSETTLEEE